jgi:zinc protease
MMGDITLEEVNAAIRKHWQYGNMQIAVITRNGEAFQQALVNGTPSPITYKNAKPEPVLREDKEIEVFPVPVKKENVRVVKVTGVLEK